MDQPGIELNEHDEVEAPWPCYPQAELVEHASRLETAPFGAAVADDLDVVADHVGVVCCGEHPLEPLGAPGVVVVVLRDPDASRFADRPIYRRARAEIA